MVLTVQEESLIALVRALPPEEASKVLTWAAQLADLARGRKIEWSDTWSEEDLGDATAESVRLMDERELQGR